MRPDISLLDHIEIATPCTASWSAMKGDDRVRFCEQCSLHVYNMAEMARDEAEKLITETEGRLCARLYRRRDGTVITKDCPVALAAARRKLAAGLTWLGTLLFACVTAVFAITGRPQFDTRLRHKEPFARICRWIDPMPPAIAGKLSAMGGIRRNPAQPPAITNNPRNHAGPPTAPRR